MALSRRGNTWHYDFWLQGRRYRGSTHEANRSRAEKVQALLMLEARERRSVLACTKIPVLKEFSGRFLDWADAGTLEPTTERYYRYGWEMLRGTKVAGMRLDAITADQADVLRFSGSPAKANVALRTLRRMLSKAVEWGCIRHAPTIRLRKELGREQLIGPEAEAMLLVAAKKPLHDVILIMQDTGMRPQDVFRMRWEHVDWHRKTIFVPFGKTKNSRRYVPMSERVMEALRGRVGASAWVFPSKWSRSGHITNVAKQWLDAREKAGLPSSVKLYCCRHTFATDALERTGNLAALMKLLGHSDAQTAMRYQHPGIEQIRRAVEERNCEHAELLARGESPHKSPHSREWVQ
jgi:integrase